MEQLSHRTADESTYYAPPLGISLLRTTTNCYFSGQLFCNKYHRTLYILEFKRSSDRNKDFLRVKEDKANEKHRSIIEDIRAAAPEWTFEQINFVAGRRGAVV